ncbi:hypothetical protein [Paraburkholderia sediminicola]|uniref:hypothetical protein n=1 Tax=Paraburkholderia sediminicola TaxID=458836 RepID=UPI0038B98CF2
MITINGEKELVRVDDWADIENRPDYDRDLDPSAHELQAIIGNYVFADKIRCGLSNCHTPHGRGYLVATKDGRLTNIGKDCGRIYFGVDFETMSRQFDRDITAKENRERLWSFSFRIDNVLAEIQQIRRGENGARGADWVHKRSRALVQLNQGVPELIVRRVSEMLRTGSDAVATQREATKEEAERADALAGRRLPRPHYVEEIVGRVSSLEALQPQNDLREILIVDLETRIKEFSALNVDALTHVELSRWTKWTGAVDLQLERAAAAVDLGCHLLTATNLMPFESILANAQDISIFRAYLRCLSEA